MLITSTGKLIGRLVTQRPQSNQLFDFIIHLTVTGQGVEKVTVDREILCLSRLSRLGSRSSRG